MVQVARGTETSAAPGGQGATSENTAGIGPGRNAVPPDAARVECSGTCPWPLGQRLRGAGLDGDSEGDLGGQPHRDMRAEQHKKDCTDRRSESPLQDSILQDV